jgi:hypothetical protein
MATFSVKDITYVAVGGTATKTTGNIDTLNSGEIGLFTPSGVRLTESSAASADSFIIVKDNGTEPNWQSGIIKKANFVASRCKAKATVAEQEQIDTLGYNGTSGSINVINDNMYHLRVNLRELITSSHGGLYVKHGFYKSDLTATQQEIAAGLHLSIVSDLSKDPDRVITIERVSNITTVNLVETYTAVRGTRWLKASGSVTCAVGDVVRFGGTTTGLFCYVVTAVGPGNAIQIDVPFQGASASGLTVSSATPAGTEAWGLKFTGVSLPFTTGKIHNAKSSWDMTLSGFGTTNFAHVQGASFGNGTERQVKELEWFARGFEGEYFRTAEHNLFTQTYYASGTYDLITLELQELYKDSITTGPINQTYILAIPSTTPNYAVTDTADDITDVLEVLVFGSVNGNFTI